MRQVHHEVVRFLLRSGQHYQGFAEIGLRLAGRVPQRHEHLLLAHPLQPHIVLHDGVAAPVAALFPQAVEDPLGRVSLFLRLVLVVFQNGVDHAQPRPQLGPLHRLLAPVARRHGVAQHLAHALAGHAELPCHRSLTLSLYKNRSPYTSIEFHRVHSSGVSRTRRRPPARLLAKQVPASGCLTGFAKR